MAKMRFIEAAVVVSGFAGGALAQVSSYVCDSSSASSVCWSTYTADIGASIGLALPTSNASSDALFKVVAPIDFGWIGFAWGGHMVYNPLTIVWPNGKSAVISSRMALGLNLPQAFDGATYTALKGTETNATHWTVIGRCRGCTMYADIDGALVDTQSMSEATLAYAYSTSPVRQPASNTSAFSVHDGFGKWSHNLTEAKSPKFKLWVNALLPAPSNTTTTASPSSSTSSATTLVTKTSTTTTAATSTSTAVALPKSCAGVTASRWEFKTAPGWKAVKVAGGLVNPRGMIWDTAGNIITIHSSKGIWVHTVGADGCISASKQIATTVSLNHGLALSPDGKTLYASSATSVFRYSYDAATRSINGTQKAIITGMYAGGHITRTLLLSKTNPDLLIVSHGSNDNFDYPSQDPAVGRSCVKVFDLTKLPTTGAYNYAKDGYMMGYGLRNEVALTFDSNNMLWGVENSGDAFFRTVGGNQSDIHNDNPAEELNYIGDVTKPNNDWYGYPTCYAVWKPSDIKDRSFKVGEQFVLAPNSTFNDTTCTQRSVAPKLTFQAHSAPLDAKFDKDYSNMYISFHGSWNRDVPTGFKVVSVPFKKNATTGFAPAAASTSTDAAQDIFWNTDVTQCGATACFRPVGLLLDSFGRFYVTSDASVEGEMFLLAKE